MDEPLEVTLLVASELQKLGVRYAVGGSMASSLHGVVRASRDVDLLVELTPVDVEPLVRAFEDRFYVDESSARDAILRKSCFNLIHLAAMFQVDLFVSRGRPFDDEELRRAVPIDTGRGPLRVATAEDVVLAKLE